MNKLDKELLEHIKKMDGNILGFGEFNDKIKRTIQNFNKITQFTILSNGKASTVSSDGIKTKTKKVQYKKIRRKFKNINYIVATYEELGKYKRRFISDSLYLSNKEVYILVTNDDTDIDTIKYRYKRYKQDIEIIECKDGILLKIKKNKYKKNIFKDKFYLIIDAIIDGINLFGDIFIS